MEMYNVIRDFSKQFAFEPKIENKERLEERKKFIVVGMGGSHLAADILKVWNPGIDLIAHQDYGLPPLPEEELRNRLIIASSYSGNTEETLDAYNTAKDRGLPLAAVSVGGKLIERAKMDGIPYAQLPDTGIQPRSALGFMSKALLVLMREEQALADIEKLSESLNPGDYEEKGKELAEKLRGYVPVIYSSGRNAPIAQNWKIKFNETGKIPAFWNVFPELNHNEMTGFDVIPKTRALSEKFYFIFLRDSDDDPRVLRRMEITAGLLKERGLGVETAELGGEEVFHKIFGALILGDWTAYYTALEYGAEPEEVPMVEEFKKLIA